MIGLALAMLGGDCAGLLRSEAPRARIESAELVKLEGGAGSACRVRGVATPVPGSRIGFELWLPRERWNGRYYQLGNGGFAGNIHAPSLAAEAARGNAAAATDTGHRGDGFDASWAAGNSIAIEDYGHRSIKATSDAAARLIATYYGRPADHRYFAGCSNGGRQALMAAARYPADWDGIVAGAPATGWTRRLEQFATLQHWLRARPERWIPAAKLPLIQSNALAGCPANKVVGGVALDPRLCRFAPARLGCAKGKGGCLTQSQIESLRRIVAAGFEPSAAAYAGGWSRWILAPDPAAPSQLTFANGAFRYLFANRPGWNVAAMRPRSVRPSAVLRATLDPDPLALAAFRRRGGRILSYFGWADPLLPPRAGLSFYRAVESHIGAAGMRDFYKLYMIPGMDHCQGGVGPTAFGQSPPAPARAADRGHDIRAAIEAWVEQGLSPAALVAWDPASGAERRVRPIDDRQDERRGDPPKKRDVTPSLISPASAAAP